MSAHPMGLTTVPRLLPVTGAFALPFAVYYGFLSLRVVGQRLKDEHYLGENSSGAGADRETREANKLYLASRSHANFAENVPLAFVLATAVELNGGNRRVLGWLLGGFLALRVLHAEVGIMRPGGMGRGRPVGYFGSVGVIGALAGYAAYLAKQYWE
ncbi:hypothetical protein LY76DRAFT_688535 [Colletotrichum caudatum]|nr:hypothetical protein LY76DRAFT_688535 [Colletotrichum caudatum]